MTLKVQTNDGFSSRLVVDDAVCSSSSSSPSCEDFTYLTHKRSRTLKLSFVQMKQKPQNSSLFLKERLSGRSSSSEVPLSSSSSGRRSEWWRNIRPFSVPVIYVVSIVFNRVSLSAAAPSVSRRSGSDRLHDGLEGKNKRLAAFMIINKQVNNRSVLSASVVPPPPLCEGSKYEKHDLIMCVCVSELNHGKVNVVCVVMLKASNTFYSEFPKFCFIVLLHHTVEIAWNVFMSF